MTSEEVDVAKTDKADEKCDNEHEGHEHQYESESDRPTSNQYWTKDSIMDDVQHVVE
jgi:hypothetical protein